MKIIKIIVVAIVAIIALILVVALFAKKEYTVQREITINKSRQDVFGYIKFLKNQDNFSVWAKKDPNLKKESTGTDGTVGFMNAWDSEMKDVGKGEQTITKIVDGERIEMSLHFIKPFDAFADAAMNLKDASQPGQTTIQWSFHSKMKYPMNIMLLFMDMDKMLGKDLSEGLSNLKIILEK